MIFDTHCHYNLEPLLSNWEDHWQQARNKGVTHSNVIGTDLLSSRQALELQEKDIRFKAVIGIHPEEFQELVESQLPTSELDLTDHITHQLQELTELANQNKVVGIGETGLDYFRLPDDATVAGQIKSLQADAFMWHIQLAEQQQVPLIVHARDQGEEAYWDILDTLKRYHSGHQPFVLHCVSGPLSYIKEALEIGAYLGLAGNLTYKNSDHLRSLARIAPEGRLLLETDAPYLPPNPFRGQTCQPWMISLTAEFLAEELGLNLETIYESSVQLFT